LLKNPHILGDVWSTLDRAKSGEKHITAKGRDSLVLNMFEDLLKSPIDDMAMYSFLLKQLCGKNRVPFA
jgi:hypothetical protein